MYARHVLLLQRLFLGDLIAQDVDAHDREWFAGCKLNHLEGLRGMPYEIGRTLLVLWVAGIWQAWFVAANALVAAALVVALWALRHGPMSRQDRVERWRWYILGRAVVVAVLGGLTLALAPEPRLAALVLALMAAYGVEAYAQFPLPVSAVAAQGLGAVAMSIGLTVRPGALPLVLLVLMVLQGVSAHIRIFNFYYLFATRRLRTRKLTHANETIQLLLNQYDEHGSDCLVDTDAAGFVRNASERLCLKLGRAVEAINGQKLVALYDPGPEREAIRRAGHRLKPFRDLVAPITTPEGQRWWLLSGCPVFDSAGTHTGFRGFIRDVTDRHLAETRVRFLAQNDALTLVANRANFHARLDAAVVQAARSGSEQGVPGPIAFAVMFIDLDRFKLINDSFGHATGDAVLIETASRLSQAIGAQGLVARLGGDEFGVLLQSPESIEAVIATGDRVINALTAPIWLESRAVIVGASIGVALAGLHGNSADELLRSADLAQYDAKSRGRGCVVVYSADLLRSLADRQAMEIELRLALAMGEFELFYQPVINLESGLIAGFEALIRWNHPQHGLVNPAQFIPLAEETGLILPIGEWVLREALAEAATWPANLTIAVNVSAMQLRGGEILRQVVAPLAASGIDPGRLELEITETVLIENEAQCLAILHRLHSLGVRIALDDFGTGYSSLNYLRSFPFDKIKIDRCFVSGLPRNADDLPGSAPIVEAVLELADKLDMATLAEGVEHSSQMEWLRAHQCGQVQGYLTGCATPAAELPLFRIAQKHAAEPSQVHACGETATACAHRLLTDEASISECAKCLAEQQQTAVGL